MDKTYAETKNKPPFDWRKWILDAIDHGVSDEEWRIAEFRASMWVTCACGNQCAIISRDPIGAPIDGILNEFGMRFYRHIREGRFDAALKSLNEIEARSAVVIAETLAKLNRES